MSDKETRQRRHGPGRRADGTEIQDGSDLISGPSTLQATFANGMSAMGRVQCSIRQSPG